jgi:dynein heavy chain
VCVLDSHQTAYFTAKVLRNLHVVLTFSPVGSTLRERAQRFPALVNRCTLNWFHAWPSDALVSVALTCVEAVETPLNPAVAENLPYHLAEVHATVVAACTRAQQLYHMHCYATPLSFLALLDVFKETLATRTAKATAQMTRLDNGLQTLQRATAQVQQLAEELQRTTVCGSGGRTGVD